MQIIWITAAGQRKQLTKGAAFWILLQNFGFWRPTAPTRASGLWSNRDQILSG